MFGIVVLFFVLAFQIVRNLVPASIGLNANILGRSFSSDLSVAGEDGTLVDASVIAAHNGTLTVRTSTTVGTLTMSDSSHGITTGSKFDIYWVVQTSPSQPTAGKRLQVTAGTVAGASIPFSLGSGDNLPIVNALITTCIAESHPFNVVGNNVVALGANSNANGLSSFTIIDTDGTTTDLQITLLASGAAYIWSSTSGVTNPLATKTVVSVLVSHGDPTKVCTLTLAAAVV